MESLTPKSPYELEPTNIFSLDLVLQGFLLKEPNGRKSYANFMKKFHGKVYTDNLYPAARSFSDRKFMHHMKKIKEANPAAIEYLDIHHHRLWYRCGFGEASKVDYLTNNISESFNKQIKDSKGLNVLNLFDTIRELITDKFYIRGQVSKQLKGRILPHVIKQLNALSKTIGRNKILWTSEHEAEVTLLDLKFVKRHIVNLKDRTCTCRVWQVSGKTPVKKAIVEEKTKEKTPVKKATAQQKAKKKTPVKKTTSKGKKGKKNVPFAPVIPPTVQPAIGAKRSLLHWLGG